MVVAPLCLLLLTLLYQVLVASSERTARATTQAQLQETAIVILQHIEDDLLITPAAGVSLHAPANEGDITVLCLNQAKTIDATSGLMVSQPDLLVYTFFPAQGTIVQRRWLPPLPHGITLNPLQSYRVQDALLLSLATDPFPLERVIARDVKLFAINSNAPAGFVGDPLIAHIVLQRQSVPNAVETCDLTRTIVLRN